MAVAITQTANPAGQGTGTTITYSTVDIGAADPSRIVAVAAGTELTGGEPVSATIDYGSGAIAMVPGTLGDQAAVSAQWFFLAVPTGTSANIAITFAASHADGTTQHIAVYRVLDGRVTGGSSVADTDADPISSGVVTIPTGGGLLAISSMATDNSTRTWAGATEDIDADAGTFQFTTAMSTTAGTPTITVSGANTEDGALSWLIFSPADRPPIGNKRRAAAMAAMLATAFIAPPPQPQVGAKFNPALIEVAAATPDEPPGGYSPKIVSIDDPHPPQRGAQIAPLLEQPVVVDDKTPYQRPHDVTLHWIPEYVSPQRLAYLTPPPAYVTPGNEDEPPGGSSPKVVSFDDPPLPQTGARLASILYEPPAVVADDPPFRYRRFQWGEGPAVVTEISFGSIIEPVDLPPRFRPFQDTSLWQPGPPEPIVHKKVPNAFLHLLIEDNHEPPGGSSPKIVSVDDPPLPQVSGKIAAALYVPPAVDNPPRLKHNQLQDRTAWQPPPPLPTLSGKLHADVLHVEPAAEEATGGGWFVTGHLGKPRGGVVTRIIDDGETDDERRQRVFKEILGDLEQVVEDKKPVKVAQAVKAIKRIAKQAPQDTTRSDELIKALRRAEAARAEADRIEQLRIAMAIAHDIERALMAAAMLKYQNEQALIALLLAD
jgi:hypothetical protein